MNEVSAASNDQKTLWNGPSGHAWVDTQELLDRMFEPFESVLIEAVPMGEGARLLDVGCGTGATTLAAAHANAAGHCTGVDISAPMLEVARRRALAAGAQADFICADAQDHGFEPRSFDAVISRFGVMFFGDSERAFANLHAATRSGRRLRFVAWRSAADNGFMTAAERAAAPLLPDMAPRRPDGPGQFAFADADRVRRILEGSGWSDVAIRPLNLSCALPEARLADYFTRLGPVAQAMQTVEPERRDEIVKRVRAAFEPYVEGIEVRYEAACWLVDARA